MIQCRCRSCGTPLAVDEPIADGAEIRCPVCQGVDVAREDGGDPLIEEVRRQIGGEVLVAVELSQMPAGEPRSLPGRCLAALQIGHRGDDWAVYVQADAALAAAGEDEWARVDLVVKNGYVLTRRTACRLFPTMNPNTYRE